MRLTKTELSYLGRLYKKTNPLALFSNIEAPLKGDEEKTLEDKDILKGGKPTGAADQLLGTVADPMRCTRLVLKDGSYFIEKYAYLSEKGYALAENDGGEVVLSPRQQLDETLFQLSQWVGMSDLRAFNMETTLSNDETVVFLAMADIMREDTLAAYLGKDTAGSISPARIQSQLEKPKPGSLVRILTGNYNYSIPEAGDTEKILDHLKAKKIADHHGGYILSGAYGEFARNFLIPQTVVMLETFNMIDKKEIAGAGVLCVWAGMREIISMTFREAETEIVSISGRQLLKMMEDFLNCPDVL